ncbi:MAG: hypothetical protein PHX83_11965 [Acidobacteriia bacterium]|nr:hypothetical protein [Terriglobia bacterium]
MAINYPKINSGHDDSKEEGDAFADFVCIEMAKDGIVLQNINSKKFQYQVGENLQGFEIKLDNRFNGFYPPDKPATGRLSIEIAEKTKAENPNFIPSGIYRGDNSWLYIQGNYKEFFIFPIKLLRQLHGSGRYQEAELPTIKKFYLPLDDARKYCAKRYIFDDNKN